MNQRDAIIRALEKRGEKRVIDRSLSKYEKWTRTYAIGRNPNGQLIPATGAGFYFIGRTGALRVGLTSTTSESYQGKLRQVLINEGREGE